MRRVIALLTILVCLGLVGCGRAADDTSKPVHVRLPMGFVANVQFAPWYVAMERGYLADEGIEVEFDYSWETDGVRLVGAGELPFAIASGDQVLLARAQGLPVITIAAWWQRFPVAVLALEESGIREPIDLTGLKVGIPETFGASYIGWQALATASGLEQDDVQLEVIGYTQLANLTENRVDAAVFYANNEPIQLAQAGYDVVLMPVADYTTLVSNGLIANEKIVGEQPELTRAFVRAFIRGLSDTIDDPDAAFDVCRKYVEGLDENETGQRAVLEATLPFWQGAVLGRSDPDAWRSTVATMVDAGLLSEPVEADQAFTNDYLP